MKRFLLGFAAGLAVVVLANVAGFADIRIAGLFSNDESNAPVAPHDLVIGAERFGSLRVILSARGAAVGDIEVDVGERPGGKMAVDITDKGGVAFFERMPVGRFVIFFNDATYPQNFERVPSLVPVEITEGEVAERIIELTER